MKNDTMSKVIGIRTVFLLAEKIAMGIATTENEYMRERTGPGQRMGLDKHQGIQHLSNELHTSLI